MLVRYFHSGHNWTTAVIVQVLGPVTYIVQTDEGQCWKRHIDQMRKFVNGSTDESVVGSGDTDSNVRLDHSESLVDTSTEPEAPSVLPDSHVGDTDMSDRNEPIEPGTATFDSEVDTAPTKTAGHHYPTRNCHPPDYYQD